MKDKLINGLAMFYSILCFVFSFTGWHRLDYGYPDAPVLLFFYSGVAFSFLPFVRKLKIFGVIEIQRFEKELAEVKSKLIMGEVVSDATGNKYLLDGKVGTHFPMTKRLNFSRRPKASFLLVLMR